MVRSPSAGVGQLRVETRSLPSGHGLGGDICGSVTTPFGFRLLVGDVMGTGWEANAIGAAVLEAWRELAGSEPSLAGVAVRLNALIAGSAHPERFVTALLMNFPDPAEAGEPGGPDGTEPGSGSGSAGARAELVCCGHPPPLLLSGGGATFLGPLPSSPPLGLLDLAEGWCAATSFPFGARDRLLLYTDGVSEARDSAGRFFPLSEEAVIAMSESGEPGGPHCLDVLLQGLRLHLGGFPAVADDILLVLVRPG